MYLCYIDIQRQGCTHLYINHRVVMSLYEAAQGTRLGLDWMFALNRAHINIDAQ